MHTSPRNDIKDCRKRCCNKGMCCSVCTFLLLFWLGIGVLMLGIYVDTGLAFVGFILLVIFVIIWWSENLADEPIEFFDTYGDVKIKRIVSSVLPNGPCQLCGRPLDRDLNMNIEEDDLIRTHIDVDEELYDIDDTKDSRYASFHEDVIQLTSPCTHQFHGDCYKRYQQQQFASQREEQERNAMLSSDGIVALRKNIIPSFHHYCPFCLRCVSSYNHLTLNDFINTQHSSIYPTNKKDCFSLIIKEKHFSTIAIEEEEEQGEIIENHKNGRELL